MIALFVMEQGSVKIVWEEGRIMIIPILQGIVRVASMAIVLYAVAQVK